MLLLLVLLETVLPLALPTCLRGELAMDGSISEEALTFAELVGGIPEGAASMDR